MAGVAITSTVLAVVPGAAHASDVKCDNDAYEITFTPDPGFITTPTAGTDTSIKLKAQITNNGVPDPTQDVFFNILQNVGTGSSATASLNPTEDNGANPSVPDADPPNTYNTVLTEKVGAPSRLTVLASFSPDTGVTCVATADIYQVNGNRTIALSFNPTKTHVKTNTSSPTTTATAVVKNALGQPQAGDTVTLLLDNTSAGVDKNCDATITNPQPPFIPPTGTTVTMMDNSDGTYTATVNAGSTPAQCTFKATDGAASDTRIFVQYGNPATVTLAQPQPNSIPANGTTQTTLTATVKDSAGNTVPGAVVHFQPDDPDVKVNQQDVTSDLNGVAVTHLTASKQVGTESVQGIVNGNIFSNTVTWTQTQPVNTTALTLTPKTIPADASSTSQATASVIDNSGTPVANQVVNFSSTGDVTFSAKSATTGADGKATVVITASKTVGNQTITATNTTSNQVATATLALTKPAAKQGYWLVASDGGIFTHGDAGFFGSEGATPLNKPIVGMTVTASGKGYWLVATDGGIFAHGDAGFFGSEGATKLNKPIVGMAATPTGKGYWLVASDGGIFAHGDAGFFGSEGGGPLNKPIVGMTPTPTGKGYWLVASDGGLFAHGDAGFFGSEGGGPLNKPVVGMAATPTGKGYWLVASDGGIFAHGDAGFFGSTGNIKLNKPVVGMAPTVTGKGYWFVASDGGIFNYGDAPFLGSEGGAPLNKPIVGMAAFGTA